MTDDLPSIVTRLVNADEQRGRPVARAQWAPADCCCPWPWPLDGGHIRLDCPHYLAAPQTPVAPFLEGCHQTDGAWVHGRPHSCPSYLRGHA